MARKKTATAVEVEEEILQAPRTRPVRVNQVTRREYIEEEAVDNATITDEDEDEFPDPFGAFNEIVTDSRNAILRIWRLPNYDVDGRTAINGVEREYCGSVVYNPDNTAMVDQIHGRVPMGGMLSLELFADGAVRKRGLLRLMKNPQAPPAGAGPITINQPPAPALPMVDPMTVVKQQAESFLAVANVIKQLQPDTAGNTQRAATIEAPEPVPLRDRLLEGVILKMVESPKPDSLERVADLLSGGKESGGWVEAALTTIGPHLGTFLTQIGPGLSAYLMRLASGGPVAAPATAAPQLNPQQPPGAPAMEPGERAWRRVMGRLLDDLFEHVNLVQSGQLGLDVHSSAEAVADLADRFQEHAQITGIIQNLIAVEPAQVIDLCCLMLPPQAIERLTPRKESPAAIEWLAELQTETRAILAGAPEETEERKTDNGEEDHPA